MPYHRGVRARVNARMAVTHDSGDEFSLASCRIQFDFAGSDEGELEELARAGRRVQIADSLLPACN